MKYTYFWLLLISLGTCQSVWAQKQTQKIIYLTNGSIICGARQITRTDSLVEVHTTEGSILRFSPDEVLKTEAYKPVFMTKGWRWGVDLGLGLGKTYAFRDRQHDEATQRMVSLHLKGGYQWNSHWITTLGIGVDAHKDLTFWPVSVRGSYLLLHRRVTPVFSAEVGYGFRSKEVPTTNNWGVPQERYAEGGLLLHPSAGIWIRTTRRTSLVVSAGYRQQTYSQHFTDTWNERRTQQVITLRRFFVSTGWVF